MWILGKTRRKKRKLHVEGVDSEEGQARADALRGSTITRWRTQVLPGASMGRGVAASKREGRGRRRRHAHSDVVASSTPARVVWDTVVGLRMHVHFHDRRPRCRPSRLKQGLEIDPPPPSSSAHYPTPFIKNAAPVLRLVPWSTHARPHVTNARWYRSTPSSSRPHHQRRRRVHHSSALTAAPTYAQHAAHTTATDPETSSSRGIHAHTARSP
ncbi:hypothetical protein B0H16DRAFT_1599106 [Mycena metata]|uniref:Uncharacterized protein n=1 Tax=Mycena metata TaxID=1033252 RepID=A0AAD7HL47_9AGAR|nr:hypothetical protein B0H16DRAFT_1599106 [Mycena metata]